MAIAKRFLGKRSLPATINGAIGSCVIDVVPFFDDRRDQDKQSPVAETRIDLVGFDTTPEIGSTITSQGVGYRVLEAELFDYQGGGIPRRIAANVRQIP